jgi:UDP-N-acetyl-D-mannosaminuronate dehydrogenase/intein/homing endonuclease
MSDTLSALLQRIQSKRATVGIIGLGYVGLPLARAFTSAGFRVLGFDIDTAKVEKLNAGKSFIKQIPDATVAAMRAGGFEATDAFARLSEPDAILICVPTPLTEAREPDLTYVVNSANAISSRLRRGQLVVLESTTYPSTTRNVMLPVLERTGLVAGIDFFVAFSPEREDPGNPTHSVSHIPKVVGGLDDASGDVACALYSTIVPKVVRVSTPEVAEACKILENTYRAINIALVNEMKVLYDRMGIDVWEVIDAAKTKPFGFQAFYPGPGLGGHCLAGHEWVTVRDSAGVHTVRFAELFEQLASGAREGSPGVEEVYPTGLEALSVDPESGKASFGPITHLFRRNSPTPLLKVHVRGNRHLTVTDGHPMLVRGYDGIEERRADDLKPGDEIVLLSTWPEGTGSVPTLDLIDVAVRHDLTGIRVMPRAGKWHDYDVAVRPACIARQIAAKDVYRYNTLPLSVYLDLEAEGCAPFARSEVLLVTGKGSSWNQVPAVLPVNEDFARLVGYYLSEGCITDDKALRTRLCFGAHEDELIRDACDILTQLGLRHSVHRLSTCQTVHIKVSSKLFATLLRDELRCGVRSEDAHAPALLMNGPRPIRRALLAGLLRGDGDVYLGKPTSTYRRNNRTYTHRNNAISVGYFTSSPVLFQQAMLLLHGDGVIPVCHKHKPHLRVSGRQAETLEPLLAAHKRERLATFRENRTCNKAPRSWHDHGGYATAEVVSAERVEPGPVFSMEVEGNHTFVTSFGIAVHNCIPLDPFYLSWIARHHGMTTRFIELAGEVNTAMPAYVIAKVADALNDAGKAVRGSKVAILGMAYKKDVDDPRESPSFELLDHLLKKGATVTYNDPHIPELPRMRHWPHLEPMQSHALTPEYLAAQDCVLIATDHTAYDYDFIVRHSRLVIDTRNATKAVAAGRGKIVRA